MTWVLVPDADVAATWDDELSRFADQNVYQSSAWGQYKRVRGWTPAYLRAESNGTVIGLLQALLRVQPFRTIVAWCPGGPVGERAVCSRESMRSLSSVLGARAMYCRSTFLRPHTAADDDYLRRHGWRRASRTVGAPMSAIWNLQQSEEQLLAGLNRNWRYSLRQALKKELRVERFVNPPVAELAGLCREMNAAKGLSAGVNGRELTALFEPFGERALVYGCRNAGGRLIAFHSCAIQGGRAWELVAATSEEGRRCGASFAVLWSLVQECRRQGVTHYDLAGMDPEAAPGVTSFKRWTGAVDVEWLGEWEWSTSPLLRHVVHLAARTRQAGALP